MKLTIDRRICEKFPGVMVGAVAVKGMDNSGVAEDVLTQLRGQEARVRAAYETETLSHQPKIDIWRKAYSAFGGKPKENRSSVENLYRMVLKGAELRHINKLVDIYNLISLKHMLPAGGEDTDKMRDNITLTFAGPSEEPVLLLGEREVRPPHEGEVIYKDAISTICRRWNWREADRTKLTEETKNCILVLEGLPPVSKDELESALKEMAGLAQKYCGASVTTAILDKNRPEFDF